MCSSSIKEPARRVPLYGAFSRRGMRRRVGIARALAVKPAILLMNEPLSALDSAMIGRPSLRALATQSSYAAEQFWIASSLTRLAITSKAG